MLSKCSGFFKTKLSMLLFKLDRVGPFGKRPSTNCFVIFLLQSDMWQLTWVTLAKQWYGGGGKSSTPAAWFGVSIKPDQCEIFVLLSLYFKRLSIVKYIHSTLMTQCAGNRFESNMHPLPTRRGMLAEKRITIILMGIIPNKSTFRKCKYNLKEKLKTSTSSQRFSVFFNKRDVGNAC